MNADYDSILRAAPKADLHNHLTLGVHPRTLLENFSDARLRIPKRYFGLPGMIRFIHNRVNEVMRDADSVVKFMELAIEDSIRDNVVLLEASVDVKLKKHFGDSPERVLDVVTALKKKYGGKIEFKPDIGIDKDIDYRAFKNVIYECLESGAYHGIDLYGIEKKRPLSHFCALFADAHRKGIKTKVHIGEFSNASTIEEAIALLDPDVIQHGIRAVQSKNTLDLIKRRNITLNVCPQSNVALMSVRSIKNHPIRKLVDYGINVTINTDDLLLFGSTISDQYLSLIERGVLTYEQIEAIRARSLKGSRLSIARN
jgi:adenosine deaminase